jgi:thiol-disulfide isomerase/thioredoxin
MLRRVADVLYFVASWSGPCMQHRPVMAAAAEQLGIEFREVDADEASELHESYGVHTLPSIAVEGVGVLVIGPLPADEIVERLRDYIA